MLAMAIRTVADIDSPETLDALRSPVRHLGQALLHVTTAQSLAGERADLQDRPLYGAALRLWRKDR